MLAYLDLAYEKGRKEGTINTLDDLLATVHSGSLERIRPMVMAGLANILGLLPTMWATGTGADVMKRLAAPMVGGVLSALLLTLFVVPVVYSYWRWHAELKPRAAGRAPGRADAVAFRLPR